MLRDCPLLSKLIRILPGVTILVLTGCHANLAGGGDPEEAAVPRSRAISVASAAAADAAATKTTNASLSLPIAASGVAAEPKPAEPSAVTEAEIKYLRWLSSQEMGRMQRQEQTERYIQFSLKGAKPAPPGQAGPGGDTAMQRAGGAPANWMFGNVQGMMRLAAEQSDQDIQAFERADPAPPDCRVIAQYYISFLQIIATERHIQGSKFLDDGQGGGGIVEGAAPTPHNQTRQQDADLARQIDVAAQQFNGAVQAFLKRKRNVPSDLKQLAIRPTPAN